MSMMRGLYGRKWEWGNRTGLDTGREMGVLTKYLVSTPSIKLYYRMDKRINNN